MTQEQNDFRFLLENLAREVIELLIQERGLTMLMAFDTLYGSNTFRKMERTRTGLYYQSSRYVMELLSEENSVRHDQAQK